MIILKFSLLFFSIVTLVLILEQLYLLALALKYKAKLKDNGLGRLILIVVFSISTALLVAFWDKF